MALVMAEASQLISVTICRKLYFPKDCRDTGNSIAVSTVSDNLTIHYCTEVF